MIKQIPVYYFITVVLFLTLAVGAAEANGNPDKFTQTFLYKIANPNPAPGQETMLAKYDIITFKRNHYNSISNDTWGAIKAINPDIELYLYMTGKSVHNDDDEKTILFLNNLGRWNVSRGHSMGNCNTDNPDMFLLDNSGNRVVNRAHPENHFLDFGTTKVSNYWLEGTINDIVNQAWVADGVYLDVTSSIEAQASASPVKYDTAAKWAPAMNGYCDRITGGLNAVGQKAFFNRGSTRSVDGYNAWIALDAYSHPPDAVLEEGAFAVRWGSGDVQFYAEDLWKRQVDLLSLIHNSKVAYQSHSDINPGESGTDNWGKPFDFWDVLWYALSSFQLGKNTVDNNSYYAHHYGSYSNIYWHDEYDIDLGNAVGTYKTTDYGGNTIYWREFERGYVYVNPTRNNVSGITLPETCKQLDHSNFINDPSTISDTNTINLDSHRGTMLLISNADTTPPAKPTGLDIVE